MDAAAQAYVDGIDPSSRALFDRIHRLFIGEFADLEVGLAYKMPVYRRVSRSLNVGACKHGVSIYGCPDEGTSSILERHPEPPPARARCASPTPSRTTSATAS